jgi:hypothetical protein
VREPTAGGKGYGKDARKRESKIDHVEQIKYGKGDCRECRSGGLVKVRHLYTSHPSRSQIGRKAYTSEALKEDRRTAASFASRICIYPYQSISPYVCCGIQFSERSVDIETTAAYLNGEIGTKCIVRSTVVLQYLTNDNTNLSSNHLVTGNDVSLIPGAVEATSNMAYRRHKRARIHSILEYSP